MRAQIPAVVVVFQTGHGAGAVVAQRVDRGIRVVERDGLDEVRGFLPPGIHVHPIGDQVVDVEELVFVDELPMPA